jgi:2-keto-4-pentenoate hydratase/2-oxohepta-3-ene-1,7-dioic acid hydratase in catechol pathway
MFYASTGLIFILLMAAHPAAAQEEKFLTGKYGTGHLSAAVTNNNVTFSWPAQAGKWSLMEKSAVSTDDWKPVASAQYHTNASTVSVTLPVPAQEKLYCVKRSYVQHQPMLPPTPQASTNRPPKPPLPAKNQAQ